MQAYLNQDPSNGALQDLESVINQSPPRAAKADIYLPSDFATTKAARGAVVFAHAFVQPSYSYTGVIRQLQRAGWVVVAPLTDVFDVLGRDIGVKLDQKRADTKLQSTLQVGGDTRAAHRHPRSSNLPNSQAMPPTPKRNYMSPTAARPPTFRPPQPLSVEHCASPPQHCLPHPTPTPNTLNLAVNLECMQAALIVDVLRAHQLLMDEPTYTGLVDKVVFMGHSLGGACSIIAAAKVQVRQAYAEAPACVYGPDGVLCSAGVCTGSRSSCWVLPAGDCAPFLTACCVGRVVVHSAVGQGAGRGGDVAGSEGDAADTRQRGHL